MCPEVTVEYFLLGTNAILTSAALYNENTANMRLYKFWF